MENKLRLIPIVSIVLLIIVPICGSMATDHIRTLELNDNKNSLSVTDLKFSKQPSYGSTYYNIDGYLSSTKPFDKLDVKILYFDNDDVCLGSDIVTQPNTEIKADQKYSIHNSQLAGGKATKAEIVISMNNKYTSDKDVLFYKMIDAS